MDDNGLDRDKDLWLPDSRRFKQYATPGDHTSGQKPMVHIIVVQNSPQTTTANTAKKAPPPPPMPMWKVLAIALCGALIAGLVVGKTLSMISIWLQARDAQIAYAAARKSREDPFIQNVIAGQGLPATGSSTVETPSDLALPPASTDLSDPQGAVVPPSIAVPDSSLAIANPSEDIIVSVVANAQKSIARITAYLEGEEQAGSGFVVREDGLIVTNEHVVRGASQVTATIEGITYPVRVVAYDQILDLAVLKVLVDSVSFRPLPLADSSKLQLAQKVIVIGMPYSIGDSEPMGLGESPTVTTGIISGLDRRLLMDSLNDIWLEGVIQTDASINPGNSGGPMLDSSGRVVGVVSSVLAGAENVGFAIPSNQVYAILRTLPE